MALGYKEYVSQFGNGKRNNKIFVLNSGQTMTLNFKDSGTDTSSNKYYNLGSEAKKVKITNNKIAKITHIQNQEQDFPITLGTANANTWRDGIEWGTIVVRADQDTTAFEVYAS